MLVCSGDSSRVVAATARRQRPPLTTAWPCLCFDNPLPTLSSIHIAPIVIILAAAHLRSAGIHSSPVCQSVVCQSGPAPSIRAPAASSRLGLLALVPSAIHKVSYIPIPDQQTSTLARPQNPLTTTPANLVSQLPCLPDTPWSSISRPARRLPAFDLHKNDGGNRHRPSPPPASPLIA